MKVGLEATSEIGTRAGRVILAERTLEMLGVIDGSRRSNDPRVVVAPDLDDLDVVFTDSEEPTSLIERARAEGVACVTWVDHQPNTARGPTLVTGANLANGLAPALVSHEAAANSPAAQVTVAWTEPGKPLRRGEPVTFPDPVGTRWGRVRDVRGTTRRIAAPVPDEWAGAVAVVRNGSTTHIVGVADLAPHLEAIALAAAVIAAAEGAYQPGLQEPAAVDAYLLSALRCGLDVATFSAR